MGMVLVMACNRIRCRMGWRGVARRLYRWSRVVRGEDRKNTYEGSAERDVSSHGDEDGAE